jgi:hypothetical protein
MLHNGQCVSYSIGGIDEGGGCLVSPNLEHIVDHKGGQIAKELTKVPECLKFYYDMPVGQNGKMLKGSNDGKRSRILNIFNEKKCQY